MAAEFVTPVGRVSFPNVFEPKAMNDGEPKYSITLLLPKKGEGVAEFIAKLQAGIKRCIEEKWPNADKRPREFKYGIKDGDTCKFESGENTGRLKKEKYPEMEGCWVIQASSKQQPGVISTENKAIMDSKALYAGCDARISFNVFAYNNVNVGVGCGLQNVMKIADNEPFGNGSRAEDDFASFLNGDSETAAAAVEEDSMFS